MIKKNIPTILISLLCACTSTPQIREKNKKPKLKPEPIVLQNTMPPITAPKKKKALKVIEKKVVGIAQAKTYRIYHRGNPLHVTCEIADSGKSSQIHVENMSERALSVIGKWRIDYYGKKKRHLKTNQAFQHLSLSKKEIETFPDRFTPARSQSCIARLIQ